MARRAFVPDSEEDKGIRKGAVPGNDGRITPESKDGQATLIAVLDCIVTQFVKRSLADVDTAQPSISDLVRIVQLRRDLLPEQPIREIEVKWVESSETGY